MENIIKITTENGDILFLTKVNNRSIKVMPAISRLFSSNECSAICAGEAMAKHIYETNGERITIEEINMHEAFNYSMKRNPVFKVIDNSETAIRTGIKPWHHCFAIGDKVFCIVWDTRMIDQVIPIEQITWSDCTILKTDNGQEFTHIKRTDKIHPLDILLNSLNITHKLIKPRTPRHNGKVERSHRNDQQRFYSYLKFYSYNDLTIQMKAYLKRSNNIPMQSLNWLTPLEMRQQIIEKNNIK
jgi:hypothetical protein